MSRESVIFLLIVWGIAALLLFLSLLPRSVFIALILGITAVIPSILILMLLFSVTSVDGFLVPAFGSYLGFVATSIFAICQKKLSGGLFPLRVFLLTFLHLIIPAGILFVLAASAMYRGF